MEGKLLAVIKVRQRLHREDCGNVQEVLLVMERHPTVRLAVNGGLE